MNEWNKVSIFLNYTAQANASNKKWKRVLPRVTFAEWKGERLNRKALAIISAMLFIEYFFI